MIAIIEHAHVAPVNATVQLKAVKKGVQVFEFLLKPMPAGLTNLLICA
jgi:hypothetical protein